MSPAPENACLPQEVQSGPTGKTRPGQPPAADAGNYDELLQAYNQLRERSLRTTNALASAAHDLKTPLAILNGYIELLESEKLGVLNERQTEVLRDMHSSGQRLQHFIQDFLSYSVLETGEIKMPVCPKSAGSGRIAFRRTDWRSTFWPMTSWGRFLLIRQRYSG
jgi:signal transduction histidine kinase